MEEKKQNVIGIIALIIIVIAIVFFWLFFTGNNNNPIEEGILTPLEVTADPAAYTDSEINVQGIVIDQNQEESSFLIMPINIFLQCGRNAYCGEEYTHLKVIYQGTIPTIEHDVIVTGNLEKKSDDTYELIATNIQDKGKV